MNGLEHKDGERCVVCENVKKKGYHILSAFICNECDKDIIQTETDDQAYMFFVKQLRKIMSKQNISHS